MSAVKSTGKIGILVEFNFEDAELIYPYYRMKEAGFDVVLIGPKKDVQYKGKHGYPVKSDISVDDVSSQELCCLIVPGGWAPDYWRRDKRFLQLLTDVDQQGGLVCTICHGAWLLCSNKPVLRGRRLTAFAAIKDDVENAGGVWLDQDVVVDGNLVTSRIPQDLPAFCKAILNLLQ